MKKCWCTRHPSISRSHFSFSSNSYKRQSTRSTILQPPFSRTTKAEKKTKQWRGK